MLEASLDNLDACVKRRHSRKASMNDYAFLAFVGLVSGAMNAAAGGIGSRTASCLFHFESVSPGKGSSPPPNDVDAGRYSSRGVDAEE